MTPGTPRPPRAAPLPLALPLALLIALAAPLGAQATTTAPPLDTAAFLVALRDEVRLTRSPGASMAVVVGDRVAWRGAVGVASAETGEPMTPATLVRIGSVTKAVTGLLAGVLEAEGRIDARAPVGRAARGLSPAMAALPLDALLAHTAGMVNLAAADGPHDDDALARRVRGWKEEMTFAPVGDVYSYASPGYWLAGHVLAEAAGRPYADLVAERVLAPLGMTRSTVRPLVAFTWPHAQDHRVRGDSATVVRPYPDDATTWPSGSLFSSADELGRLAVALVNAGRIDGRQALPAAAVAAMLAEGKAAPGNGCAYARGLSVCRRGDVVTASHYGFRGGSGAVFTLVPSRRLAVVILANRNGGILARTEAAVLRGLGVPDATEPPAGPRPASRDFAGTWANGRDTLRVRHVAGDSLRYRYGPDEQAARVDETGTLLVLGADGAPVQGFTLVRGARTGAAYLHDGLNAFRRVGAR